MSDPKQTILRDLPVPVWLHQILIPDTPSFPVDAVLRGSYCGWLFCCAGVVVLPIPAKQFLQSLDTNHYLSLHS